MSDSALIKVVSFSTQHELVVADFLPCNILHNRDRRKMRKQEFEKYEYGIIYSVITRSVVQIDIHFNLMFLYCIFITRSQKLY